MRRNVLLSVLRNLEYCLSALLETLPLLFNYINTPNEVNRIFNSSYY